MSNIKRRIDRLTKLAKNCPACGQINARGMSNKELIALIQEGLDKMAEKPNFQNSNSRN